VSEPTQAVPVCWCVYGREGREVETPGCPAHDPNGPTGPKPYRVPDDHVCERCAEGPEECGCYGEDEDCPACGGTGEHIPDHCCVCGGSPYCQCCKGCGAPNAGGCGCPITVQRSDGTTKTL
jgi:hypothetical protein